mgnify:CR=1 FL=1
MKLIDIADVAKRSGVAASALRHNLILATRYVKEYFRSGVQIVNPWQET